MKVRFSYLDRQFEDVEPYLAEIRSLVKTGDYTLGSALEVFETRFAALCGMPHAIGVGSGTDALALSLKVLGVGPGDEVITTPMTFIATVGAIVMVGARPVFVDSDEGFVIDAQRIEDAITSRTKAIIPVHYSGNLADMPVIVDIAERRGVYVIEDACQAVGSTLDGRPAGSWGTTGCFSLHPLKNLNVWGDGGIVVTGSEEVASRIRTYRNHGLVNRDEAVSFGVNSRLDTLQAIVGNRLMDEIEWITARRLEIAKRYDEAFAEMNGVVTVPPRRPKVKHAFHLYIVRVEQRDGLLSHLHDRGVEAKIHYPIPVHLQEAAKDLGYGEGDFPMCEADCRRIVTLPAHQHLDDDQLDYVIACVREFYEAGGDGGR